MIVVPIQMWPHGVEAEKRDLAYVCIANIGGDLRLGNYQWWISHQKDSPYGRNVPDLWEFATGGDTPGVWKHGTIEGFPRHLGTVKLLARVLKAARLTDERTRPPGRTAP